MVHGTWYGTVCCGMRWCSVWSVTNIFSMFQDLPSVTRGVHRFVSDVRYYRLYNSSLPSGTVTF
jgi:spermidine synthase